MAHTNADVQIAAQHFGEPSQSALASRGAAAGSGVTYVYHDPDGEWWFLSEDYNDEDDEDLVVMCLPCLLNKDPGLIAIADLPVNWIAERGSLGEDWQRESRPADWGAWEDADANEAGDDASAAS